ncbi:MULTISPECIES: glycosyltransferase family 4 protein [unclassified Tenacibaculum]|uniref:glycosyltransferase family 4 protein n=2 Tax=Tenacibaculum TaxID=104267 RepID=UPI001F2D66B3|nr:glycosyltransferase family 4 protein [Tenacibaculum sp. Cn5-34]MCF2876140.1 glycosyltransferase family 4 protein [Tenacibaculum sp. Cn5-1]MCF2936215.1 glycosyltransferase family 4 protein [Tenacibaculum sp. Cn5-34]MCG7511558.1 glycosyltransferase family 4 protein [Tenacibaculum sp. Cn5-46]
MRIGMILDKIFPPDPRVENEAIELINNGHEVFLFCLTYTNQKKEEEVNQITIKRYKSNKLEYKLSALAYTIPLYSILMEKKINHFLKETRIEAIHIHDMVIAEAVFKANKKLGLPIVLDLHENRPEIMKFYPHLKRFPSNVLISPKKWKEKEESFIKKANRVIVVTKDAKEEIVERTKIDSNTISVVPNTVRSSFYEKSLVEVSENKKKDNFVLLYIGDTGERRGLKTVVRSLPKLAKAIKNIKLVIVGKVTNELKLEVDKLKITNYVNFQGWQNESTFVKYIQESDVCLSPLHRNIHHDTTYANKLFQYMSLGKPLIVSNATAQKKLVEEYNTGLVHKEKDVEDFENKVLELYNNPLLREQLGKNGRGFVQNEFTWDKTSKELINLYAGL